jgi:hypothetical protein
VLNGVHGVDFAAAYGGAAKYQRLHRRVEPHEHAGILETTREIKTIPGHHGRLDPVGLQPHVRADQVERLREGPVQLPRIAPAQPADAMGIDACLEQPHTGVDRRLPRSDHRKALREVDEVDEVVGAGRA